MTWDTLIALGLVVLLVLFLIWLAYLVAHSNR
jgi:uncharacterized membrane protein YukC